MLNHPYRRRTFVLLLYVSLLSSVLPESFRSVAQELNKTVSAQAYFTEPAISPDRKEIAFVSGGDIWTVPSEGGAASLLVSNPANESRPIYSPDGKQLAFISTRTGNGDIYLLNLATGDSRRLTFDDGFDQLDGWSRDGRWVYFLNQPRYWWSQ